MSIVRTQTSRKSEEVAHTFDLNTSEAEAGCTFKVSLVFKASPRTTTRAVTGRNCLEKQKNSNQPTKKNHKTHPHTNTPQTPHSNPKPNQTKPTNQPNKRNCRVSPKLKVTQLQCACSGLYSEKREITRSITCRTCYLVLFSVFFLNIKMNSSFFIPCHLRQVALKHME